MTTTKKATRKKAPAKKVQAVRQEFQPKSLDEALLMFQARFDGVDKLRVNTFTNSMYAALDDVMNKAVPILTDLKVRISYPLALTNEFNDGDPIQVLVCRLTFVPTGETEESTVLLPDPATNPQVFGSHLTYYRRYLAACMLNIVETADDDGNAAQAPPPPQVQLISEKQHSAILDFVEATKTKMGTIDEDGTLVHHIHTAMNVDSVDQLDTRQASIILKMLKTKHKRQQAAQAEGEPNE